MFDKYSLNARLYPMLILFLPLVIIGISYSIEYENRLQILTTLGVTAAFSYLLSNLGRDIGKRKESKLWQKWGGMPTIQLLSFSNNRIDKITKQRYHSLLLKLSPIDSTIDYENTDEKELNEIYKSWAKLLISKTRDTKKYSLLFKENISYGFRRNLWGLKTMSIFLIIISLIANYLFHAIKLGFYNLHEYPIEFYISESLNIGLLFFWLIVIRPNWIEIPAFAYGERLLETIDTL